MKRKKKKRTENYTDYYNEIVDDLFEFNQKYIEKSIDLEVHKNYMDAQIYKSVQAALAEQYVSELALKRAQSRSKTNERFYLAEGLANELAAYSYYKRFRWHSSPMKRILDNRIASEAAGYFEELEEGIEPDHDEAEDKAAGLMYTLVYETVGRFKRRKVIKRVGRRLVYYIDEYIKAECIPERRAALFELIAKELSRQTDTTQFKLLNGEYIKGLLGEHIRTLPPEPAQPEQAPADDTEEPLEASEEGQPEQAAESEEPEKPAEDVEDAEDDLSALYELADEPDAEEPAAPGEVQEHAEQAATASEEAPEQANDVADDVEQMQMLMPQSEGSAEPEEPDTGANADKGEETENTD